MSNEFKNHKVSVSVRAGAKKSEITGFHGQYLKIKIAAKPESGKANQEIIDFLSQELHCKKNQISILQGLTNKYKLIQISNYSEDKFLNWLKAIEESSN